MIISTAKDSYSEFINSCVKILETEVMNKNISDSKKADLESMLLLLTDKSDRFEIRFDTINGFEISIRYITGDIK